MRFPGAIAPRQTPAATDRNDFSLKEDPPPNEMLYFLTGLTGVVLPRRLRYVFFSQRELLLPIASPLEKFSFAACAALNAFWLPVH